MNVHECFVSELFRDSFEKQVQACQIPTAVPLKCFLGRIAMTLEDRAPTKYYNHPQSIWIKVSRSFTCHGRRCFCGDASQSLSIRLIRVWRRFSLFVSSCFQFPNGPVAVECLSLRRPTAMASCVKKRGMPYCLAKQWKPLHPGNHWKR